MGTTPAGLPWPEDNAPLSDIAKAIKALADGLDARPRAIRSLNTPQSIPNNAFTAVLFDTAEALSGITYNAATGEFTVPKAGIYSIAGQVRFNANATGRRIASVSVNGTPRSDIEVNPAALPAVPSAPFAAALVLAAGDKVKVSAFQTSGAALTVYGSAGHNDTRVSIVQVA